MLTHLLIAMSPCSQMKVSLDLINVQAAINTTAVAKTASPEPRRLAPLGILAHPALSPCCRRRNNIMHMLLAKALVIMIALARDDATLGILAQTMHALDCHPLTPVRRVQPQLLRREDPVASGILDIDVNVGTAHGNDEIQIDLQIVPNALFNTERVYLGTAPPPRKLREREEYRNDHDGNSPLAATRRPRYILRFGLCYELVSYSIIQYASSQHHNNMPQLNVIGKRNLRNASNACTKLPDLSPNASSSRP